MKKIKLSVMLIFTFIIAAAFGNNLIKPVATSEKNSESYKTIITIPNRLDTEYINYSRKEESKYLFMMPSYTHTNASACGPVSGAIITGYYAYFYPSLVPGFQTYYISPTYGLGFYPGNQHIKNLINDYINIMCAQTGVTVAHYKEGLGDYFELIAGKIMYFDRLALSGGGIHFYGCMQEIDAGRPITLFMSYYNTSILSTPQDGRDELITEVYINNHIFTACGYKTIKYYKLQSGVETLFRTDNYLFVETGWETSRWVYLGYNMVIDDAYGIGVY